MEGALVSEENGAIDDGTSFDLTFDPKVTRTKSFYPPISYAKLFSQLGGTLGLWLGIGMMQMCITVTTVFWRFSKLFSTQLI